MFRAKHPTRAAGPPRGPADSVMLRPARCPIPSLFGGDDSSASPHPPQHYKSGAAPMPHQHDVVYRGPGPPAFGRGPRVGPIVSCESPYAPPTLTRPTIFAPPVGEWRTQPAACRSVGRTWSVPRAADRYEHAQRAAIVIGIRRHSTLQRLWRKSPSGVATKPFGRLPSLENLLGPTPFGAKSRPVKMLREFRAGVPFGDRGHLV